MPYKVKGKTNRPRKKGAARVTRQYTSRKTFRTDSAAREWAYNQIYNPSGNTKKTDKSLPFHSWHVEPIKSTKRGRK